jgi:alkylated DNA repair dioxygenase AlkB
MSTDPKETQTITITFGDVAENHVRMQQIGQLAEEGFDLDDLMKAKNWFEEHEVKTRLIHLNKLLDAETEADDAYILIIRKGLNELCDPDDFFDEQINLRWDKKALMYGRVVNKSARYNLCYAKESQKPDYENGKGRIISYEKVPLLYKVKKSLKNIIGSKAKYLQAEGNYYYDIDKCGIGFHGDTERRLVIGIRVGATTPLVYQWFYLGKTIGERKTIQLNHGDIYIMSEKAVGHDWKKKVIPTLRHAAGSDKFITL